MSTRLRVRGAPSVLALSIAWAAVLSYSFPVLGQTSGQALQAQQSSTDQGDVDYNGEDFTRPVRSFEMRFRYQTSPGTIAPTQQGNWLLRLNWKAELGGGWRTGLLGQIPVVDKLTIDPTGANNEFGFGDTAVQGALIHDIDRYWAFGFGARLVGPTAQDSLGTGKWQIMPGFGVRYSFLEVGPDTYFVPVVRYAISFAGNPSRRNISEPQIAPTLNIGLPDRWFVTLYPSNDIRINYGGTVSGQTGRLFLPFDFSVGRKITDRWTISLEASVPMIDDYPVYNFKTELRIVMQF